MEIELILIQLILSSQACNISTSAQIAFKMPSNLGFINGHVSPSSSSSNTNNSVPPKNKSIFEKLFESKRIDVWPFFRPGEKIVVAASMNGGNVIERFVKMLRFWCRQLGCPAVETSQVNIFISIVKCLKSVLALGNSIYMLIGL